MKKSQEAGPGGDKGAAYDESTNCGICGSKESYSYCLDCKFSLCLVCMRSHDLGTKRASHTKISMRNLDYCEFHDAVSTLICKECNLLICEICSFEKERCLNHSTDALQDFITGKTNYTDLTTIDLKSYLSSLEKKQNDVKSEVIQSINVHAERAIENINDQKNRLISSVDLITKDAVRGFSTEVQYQMLELKEIGAFSDDEDGVYDSRLIQRKVKSVLNPKCTTKEIEFIPGSANSKSLGNIQVNDVVNDLDFSDLSSFRKRNSIIKVILKSLQSIFKQGVLIFVGLAVFLWSKFRGRVCISVNHLRKVVHGMFSKLRRQGFVVGFIYLFWNFWIYLFCFAVVLCYGLLVVWMGFDWILY